VHKLHEHTNEIDRRNVSTFRSKSRTVHYKNGALN